MARPAPAATSKGRDARETQPRAPRPLVAKGNRLLRKRIQAGARAKAGARGAPESSRGARKTVACPLPVGSPGTRAGAGGFAVGAAEAAGMQEEGLSGGRGMRARRERGREATA